MTFSIHVDAALKQSLIWFFAIKVGLQWPPATVTARRSGGAAGCHGGWRGFGLADGSLPR